MPNCWPRKQSIEDNWRDRRDLDQRQIVKNGPYRNNPGVCAIPLKRACAGKSYARPGETTHAPCQEFASSFRFRKRRSQQINVAKQQGRFKQAVFCWHAPSEICGWISRREYGGLYPGQNCSSARARGRNRSHKVSSRDPAVPDAAIAGGFHAGDSLARARRPRRCA